MQYDRNLDAILRHSLTRKSGGGVVTFAREANLSKNTKDKLAHLKKLKDAITSEVNKLDQKATNGHVSAVVDSKSDEIPRGQASNCETSTDPASDKRKACDAVDGCDVKKPRLLDSAV